MCWVITENKQKFIRYTQENDLIFIHFLLKIKKLGLLTTETGFIILDHLHQVYWLKPIIEHLANENLTITIKAFIQLIALSNDDGSFNNLFRLAGIGREHHIPNSLIFDSLVDISDDKNKISAAHYTMNQLMLLRLIDTDILTAFFSNLSHISKIYGIIILLFHTYKLNKENLLIALTVEIDWDQLVIFHQDTIIDKALFQTFMTVNDNNVQLYTDQILEKLSFFNLKTKKALTDIFNIASRTPEQCAPLFKLLELLSQLSRTTPYQPPLNEQAFLHILNNHVYFSDMHHVLGKLSYLRLLNNSLFQLIITQPNTMACAVSMLDGAKLLNQHTCQILSTNPHSIYGFSSSLYEITSRTMCDYYPSQPIYQHFLDYFLQQTHCFNRSQILYEWAMNYIEEKKQNPFTLLTVLGKSHHTSFFSAPNFFSTFITFIEGDEPHAALMSLMFEKQEMKSDYDDYHNAIKICS